MENALQEQEMLLSRLKEKFVGKMPFTPRVALVLGSGLSDVTADADVAFTVNFTDLEGFPTPTVSGHHGQFIFCRLDGIPLLVMSGRVHLYEGHSPQTAVLPVRLMHALGVETLILTNAAGGIADTLSPGCFMLVSDHISTFVPSPLRGPNNDLCGPRFPDMTEAYDAELRRLAKDVASRLDLSLSEGVYVQVPGPQFETPAEIRMLRALGADAVGMSTVIETVAARHLGMRVLCVSQITNRAAGLSGAPLSHEEVKAIGAACAPRLRALLTGILHGIPTAR